MHKPPKRLRLLKTLNEPAGIVRNVHLSRLDLPKAGKDHVVLVKITDSCDLRQHFHAYTLNFKSFH